MINDLLYTYLCMNIGMEFPCTVWDEESESEVLAMAVLESIDDYGHCVLSVGDISVTTEYDNLTPTLYKLSDMTAEQATRFRDFLYEFEWTQSLTSFDIKNMSIKSFGLVNWLNKNRFDYLDLIEKGKAFYAKSNHEVIHL